MRNYRYGSALSSARAMILFLAMIALFWANACVVKKTVATAVPKSVLLAKDATLEQLIDIVNRQSQSVRSLRSTAVTINAERRGPAGDKIEKYRSAPGYVFLERPRNIRLKVLVPVAKNTLIDMAANGEGFKIWYPREHKFYVGRNVDDNIEPEGDGNAQLSSFRPQHLIDAILLEGIHVDDPDQGYFVQEENAPTIKYYIVSVVRGERDRAFRLLRRIWIERYGLQIVRQQYYGAQGKLLSDIRYENYMTWDGIEFPSKIRIERPRDNYTIELDFKAAKFNVDFDADTFTLARPEGAELVEIKGGKS